VLDLSRNTLVNLQFLTKQSIYTCLWNSYSVDRPNI